MFSLFHPKKNIRQTALLKGMTDVHTHLLPGVDDGFKTEKTAYEMLAYQKEQGVKRVFLTPHVSAEHPSNTPENLQQLYERFKKLAPAGIELCLAAEYMLDADFPKHLEAGLLAFPGNRVLVETSYLAAPLDWLSLLYDMSLEGYTPVIAHPERYMYMEKADYYQLKNKGYLFQLNLFALGGNYGKIARSKAAELLKLGFYEYVGSDCHSMEAYKNGISNLFLTEAQAEELQRLVRNNNELT